MMVSLLKGHPRIMCLPAIFSSKGWADWGNLPNGDRADKLHRLAALPDKWNKKKQRLADMPELLDRLLELYPEKKAVGFKQHMNGVKDPAIRRVVKRRWPAIILNRENILAAYSSNELVKVTGQGVLRAGMEPKRAKIEFVVEDFEKYLNRRLKNYEFWSSRIKATGVPVMTMEYRAARRCGGLDPVGDFLGLDADRFGKPSTEKRNSDDILSRFSNPGDAEAWLDANGRNEWAVED